MVTIKWNQKSIESRGLMFDLRARECHFDTVHGTIDYLTDAKNVKGCLFQRNVGAKSVNRPSGNTCYGGEPLIPTYENQYDSIGNFAEYVVDAKSDGNWVIAKTDNHISNQRKYYILNKKYNPNEMTVEDIINTRIECFTDSSEFAKKCLLWSPDKMVDGKSRVALVLITFRLK